MSSISDESLLLEFVTESKEHLTSIEPDLLVLEKEGSAAGQDIINSVFRAIHSIKGASGFFGLVALKNLSHTMESVLMLIRDGKLKPSSEVMDPLLVGVDKLNSMLDDIQGSEAIPYEDEMKRLELILGGPKETVAVQTKDEAPQENSEHIVSIRSHFHVDQIALDSVKKQGLNLFRISVSLDQDLALKNRSPLDLFEQLMSIGLVLDTVFETIDFPDLESCLTGKLSLLVLCATVLDLELLPIAIDIPNDQVQAISIEALSEPVLVVPVELPEVTSLGQSSEAAQALMDKVLTEASEPLVSSAVSEEPLVAAQASKSETSVEAKSKSTASSENTETIRVRVDLLNKLMDLAGEMVLSRNQLLRVVGQQAVETEGLTAIAQNVNFITSDLQEHIMQTRMQSVGSIFGKFPRIIRDMSRQLGKEIELQTSGEDVELDKTILENLSDPLTHLIRNCCDHAIETPDIRLAAGKPSGGTVALRAYHEGGQINIEITDDGKGIDHNRLVQKAMSHGLLSDVEVKAMSQQEMVNLIFLPGLSTAEKVSDISGRGVGMDVVRTNIAKIGGHISVETQMGQGTKILLRLPLTLAIIPSLVVGIGQQRFAVPQVNLVELVCIKAADIPNRIEKVSTAAVLRLRGKLLPLVKLSQVLGLEDLYYDEESGQYQPEKRQEIVDIRTLSSLDEVELEMAESSNKREKPESDYNIVVLKVGVNQFGLIVDQLFDMEEIVVKPLSELIKNSKCFAGATIMGDGRVAMILDASGILSQAKLAFSEIQAEEASRDDKDKLITKQAVILFSNALNDMFALSLASVLRLEKFNLDDIETIGNREFLTQKDKSIELLRLENYLPVHSGPKDSKEAFLLFPKVGDGRAGIIASKILDTLDVEIKIDETMFSQKGIEGTLVVNEHLTIFIDPEELFKEAGILNEVEVCAFEKLIDTERELVSAY